MKENTEEVDQTQLRSFSRRPDRLSEGLHKREWNS